MGVARSSCLRVYLLDSNTVIRYTRTHCAWPGTAWVDLCVCVCACACARVCVRACVCVCVCATSARSCDRCDGSSGDDIEVVCDYGKNTNVGMLYDTRV